MHIYPNLHTNIILHAKAVVPLLLCWSSLSMFIVGFIGPTLLTALFEVWIVHSNASLLNSKLLSVCPERFIQLLSGYYKRRKQQIHTSDAQTVATWFITDKKLKNVFNNYNYDGHPITLQVFFSYYASFFQIFMWALS